MGLVKDLVQAIVDYTEFENNLQKFKQTEPNGLEQFINENYWRISSVANREVLVKMVSEKFGIEEWLASCWITHYTT